MPGVAVYNLYLNRAFVLHTADTVAQIGIVSVGPIAKSWLPH